jgi:DNA-binding transcriptional MerR regulator
MRSIGEMARASGLTVSALRFYDGAGVLVPAVVDPETGYRWYAPQQLAPARLVASLRRVGMPLAEITRVLGQWPDSTAVRGRLDAHVRRLEDGLADARRELARIHALLDHEEHPLTATATRLTLAGADLAAAIDAVRFAVGTDPELPALAGVLFEVDGAVLRLVATDRYRLAVSATPAEDVAGPPVRVIAPAPLVDQARALLAGGGPATLTVDPDGITVQARGRQVHGQPLDHDFPDHRRLLPDRRRDEATRRVAVDVAALRSALAPGAAPTVVREHRGVPYDVAVLTVDRDGVLAIVGEDGWDAAHCVGVNREFLLDALDASGHGQLVLELDGPITPLAVRAPDDAGTFSILMPVRPS